MTFLLISRFDNHFLIFSIKIYVMTFFGHQEFLLDSTNSQIPCINSLIKQKTRFTGGC